MVQVDLRTEAEILAEYKRRLKQQRRSEADKWRSKGRIGHSPLCSRRNLHLKVNGEEHCVACRGKINRGGLGPEYIGAWALPH